MKLINSTEQPELLELEEVQTGTKKSNHLVLYNDDVNSFEYVIDSLVKVCSHDILQAEQCTYLVHYSGRCSVKVGTTAKLHPLCEALLERGLTATIE